MALTRCLRLVALAALLLATAAQQAYPVADTGIAAPPFAQAALWAATLPDLQICDKGIDEAGCPAQPEHGGAGFLSTVFTWRYALNNMRAALVATSAAGVATPAGAAESVLQLLAALDQLMQQPLIHALGEITQAARQLFESMRYFLSSSVPIATQLPPRTVSSPAHWRWPSDGRTPLHLATFTLRTGALMPAIGFGTWRLWAKQAYQPVRWALELGYRHIDTAEGYANEAEIGRAIVDSRVPRGEVFIATKASSVPKGLADLAHTEDVFNMQLAQLGTDYVDVYMLHTPPQDPAQLRTIWTVFEKLHRQGRARALGISNCDVNDLRDLLSFAQVPPAYIQNLFKVYKPGEQMIGDEDLIGLAHANQIAVMGYSIQTEWPHVLPPLRDPHVESLAAQVQRTPSQVLHRWALQRGVGVIPKASSHARIAENARLLDFELSDTAMRLLDGLATLSESGASSPVRPRFHEDVYQLGALMAAAWQPGPAATPLSAGHAGDQVAQELLAHTRDQGFPYAAIRDHLLGPASDAHPAECAQRCAREPRCAAWEVCAPFDPSSGCEGCYLIGSPPTSTIRIPGWHAAVVRGGGL